ncbi:hypothetical protein OZX76_00625 [Lactobacillus sp. ESL0677]|nr:hypothetical protein [Lactobacillus sp. ESL0677]WEV37892.1 hypothetical protein OZX76_00625 [Lactobacillus sp. ESL0677]
MFILALLSYIDNNHKK